jgi:hypothetical protein
MSRLAPAPNHSASEALSKPGVAFARQLGVFGPKNSKHPAGVKSERAAMKLLILRAYLSLLLFDLYLARNDFAGLYRKVRSCPIKTRPPVSDGIEQIRSAVDMACVWYWKEVLCLQRSAATAYLLKQFGASAQLVIGAQQMPFKAHAWVEIDGRVVNDKSYVREMYAVLDRC